MSDYEDDMTPVKATIIHMDGTIEDTTLENLDDYQRIVGGLIEPVNLADEGTLWVNDEFLILWGSDPKMLNPVAMFVARRFGRPDLLAQGIYGDVFVVGPSDYEGNDTDIPDGLRTEIGHIASALATLRNRD